MKRYKLLNNVLGWVVFVIAAVTYILTLESTASFWDCGEFIASGYKLEVGHPPGNPIFMLTARFFANFASSPSEVAYMVNLMSGLLSAATILLLFWTITRLAQKIVLRDGETEETMSLGQMIAILGCGLVGALAYAWSDRRWKARSMPIRRSVPHWCFGLSSNGKAWPTCRMPTVTLF